MQTRCLDEHLLRLAPLLDVRVLRRVARELWNTLAGVSRLLSIQAIQPYKRMTRDFQDLNLVSPGWHERLHLVQNVSIWQTVTQM